MLYTLTYTMQVSVQYMYLSGSKKSEGDNVTT
jgi:hypothetical protein